MSVLSEIAGGRGQAMWGLSISFPGSTQRLSNHPFTSATGGHFDGKVKSWGGLNYRISDRGGRLPAVETRVLVWDTDRVINRLVSGVNANSIRGSAATIYLATPTVASSSWLTVFSGKVTKVSFPEPFVAEISLRVADDQLQRMSPRGGWALSRVAWPNAAPEAYDMVAPVLYGVHDSTGMQQGPGLVPTIYVDTVQYRYLVCAGRAKSIDYVYVDGVQTGSGWAVDYVTVHGRIYTLIDFTTDQGTAEITCDANGYEAVGDGSGAVITNPATQWAHRLTNFVLGDYTSGSWLSTNALIDSTSLSAAEAYMTLLGAKGSDYDDQKRTGLDIIARFCNSFRMRAWWTLGGKIAIGYENIFSAPYGGTRWRWTRDEVAPFSLVEEDFTVSSRIVVRQARSASQGSYLSTLEVMDASFDSDTQEFLDLELSEAK